MFTPPMFSADVDTADVHTADVHTADVYTADVHTGDVQYLPMPKFQSPRYIDSMVYTMVNDYLHLLICTSLPSYCFLPLGFFNGLFFTMSFEIDSSLVGAGFSAVFRADRRSGSFTAARH